MSTPDPTIPPITPRGAMLRDDNDNPVQGFGVTLSNIKTLSANNTTAIVPIFTVNGIVEVLGLYGIITTALGNNTAAYWRLNDGTNQTNITLNTGTTISNVPSGSLIARRATATSALTLNDSVNEVVQESGTTIMFQPFWATQKTGGVATNIEFVYTTTDTPTTGVIQFFIQYLPLSQGSNITAV